MRHKSGLVALAVGMAATAPAFAQSIESAFKFSDDGLRDAAFGGAPATTSSGLAPASLSLTGVAAMQAPGSAPTRWRLDEVSRGGQGGGPVDTLRVSITETRVGPSAGVISRAPYETSGVDLSYTRDWPDAMTFRGMAVSPSAGFALTDGGAVPQAGATLRLGSGDKSVEDRLGDLVSDGKKYGDQGRWYLFAAASGRSVGLNMTRAEGGWSQSGWSTDKTSKLIGDGQLGVGYRKGAMQASFGYIYREIKVQNGPLGADTDMSDSVAAFSLSIRP